MINCEILDKYKLIIKKYTNTFRGLPKSVWKILAVHFLVTILSGTLYYFSYYFVNILSYDVKTATFFISCFGLGSIAGGLIGGKFTDIFNPRQVSISSLMLSSLSFFSFLAVETKFLLIANMFLFGLASNAFTTCNYIWVLNSCENNESQKLKSINILTVISNLGLGIAAIFLELFKIINFQLLFAIYGFIFLLLASYLLLFNKDSSGKGVTRNQKNIKIKHGSNKPFIYLMLFSLFLIGIIISQMSSTYSIYIHDNFSKYGLSGFSFLFLMNTFLVVTLQTPIGNFLDRKNNIRYVSYGALLIGLSMGILSFAVNFLEVILSIIIYTVGEIIFFSLSLLICYENSPQEKRGQWTGIYRMTFSVSRVMGPTAGGLIYYHYHAKILWFICFLMGASIFLICKLFQFRYKLA